MASEQGFGFGQGSGISLGFGFNGTRRSERRTSIPAHRGWTSRSGIAAVLAFLVTALTWAGDDRLDIAPLGKSVEVKAQNTVYGEYVLETQAKLMQGEAWAPLMQFRGGTPMPPNWVDPECGSTDLRFFRLRRLLEGPAPQASNFRLIDTEGTAHELYYHFESKAVLLLLAGTNLAGALPSARAMDAVAQRVGRTNVQTWVVVASGPAERESLAASVAAAGLPPGMPVLQDASHAVTRTLGSGVVPEVVLVDPAGWAIAYRGPVTDAVDTGAGVVEKPLLSDAVTQLLGDGSVAVSRFATRGSPAGLREVTRGEYGAQIAPLLLRTCMPCHSPGDIAPWAMTNHQVVAEFSRLIKSDVLAGVMPPWHADAKYSAFSNAKGLSVDEASMVVDWIDRGCPRGDGPDPLAQAKPVAEPDWPMGAPDAIISIPAQSIPATGIVDYRYLFAQSPFSGDVWLRGVAVKPGNRTVVHHSLVFKGTFNELLALQGGLGGFFAGYVPGMEQAMYPEGTGKQLKKADIIVFQMHYTASGVAASDVTKLGLYLAPSKPAKELVTGSAYDTSFVIPPGQPSVGVRAIKTFAKGSMLYEFSPHMHFRGASAKYTLQYPNGTRETILNVPSYYFNWQALYRLAQPKLVPAGTVLMCEGTFDNSTQNMLNPDPTKEVRFGEQSWEEMFIGYVNYTETN